MPTFPDSHRVLVIRFAQYFLLSAGMASRKELIIIKVGHHRDLSDFRPLNQLSKEAIQF